MNRRDAEIIIAPDDLRQMSIALSGIQNVRETRRDQSIKARKAETMFQGLDSNPYIRYGWEYREEGRAERQLQRSGESKYGGGNR